MEKGSLYLAKAATGNKLSKYHLEAAIAYWHTSKTEIKEKWDNILQLYNKLLQIEYSPIVALNRTYALSKTNGKKKLSLRRKNWILQIIIYIIPF